MMSKLKNWRPKEKQLAAAEQPDVRIYGKIQISANFTDSGVPNRSAERLLILEKKSFMFIRDYITVQQRELRFRMEDIRQAHEILINW